MLECPLVSTLIWRRISQRGGEHAEDADLAGQQRSELSGREREAAQLRKGALHEQAAVEFARRKGYQGIVLDISGDPGSGKNRSTSPQTLLALTTLEADDSMTGLYGFSGGGYNVWWILRALDPKARSRLTMVVVLGAPDRPSVEYEARNFGAAWELVYKKDPPKGHMFGPEQLLQETPDSIQDRRATPRDGAKRLVAATNLPGECEDRPGVAALRIRGLIAQAGMVGCHRLSCDGPFKGRVGSFRRNCRLAFTSAIRN